MALLAAAGGARADAVSDFYQGKTIHFLIGAPAGGGYDAAGRAVARFIGRHVPGNPNVVAENMPGAGGVILANFLYSRAPRDGTVIGEPTNSVPLETKLQTMGSNVAFDTGRMNWIGTPAQQPQVSVVWAAHPVHTLDDMRKTKTIFGATSAGVDTAILPSLMNQIFGTKNEVILGYNGFPDLILAMERGEIHAQSALLANVTAGGPQYLREKKVRFLVQFGSTRLPELSDTPTAIEWASNEADRDLLRFYALKYDMAYPIVAPPDVPPERIKALQDAFDKTMKDPEYQDFAKRSGLDVNPVSGAAMAAKIRDVNNAPQPIVDRLRALILPPSAK
jgi:tripartite-type tricarboxylate transporter receptor subunit TctC